MVAARRYPRCSSIRAGGPNESRRFAGPWPPSRRSEEKAEGSSPVLPEQGGGRSYLLLYDAALSLEPGGEAAQHRRVIVADGRPAQDLSDRLGDAEVTMRGARQRTRTRLGRNLQSRAAHRAPVQRCAVAAGDRRPAPGAGGREPERRGVTAPRLRIPAQAGRRRDRRGARGQRASHAAAAGDGSAALAREKEISLAADAKGGYQDRSAGCVRGVRTDHCALQNDLG